MIWDTMALGIRALMFAANVAGAETKEEAHDATMPSTVMWTTVAVAILGRDRPVLRAAGAAMAYLDQYIGSALESTSSRRRSA